MTTFDIRRRWLELLHRAIASIEQRPGKELAELRAFRRELENDYPALRGFGVDSGLFGSTEALLFQSFGSGGVALSRIKRLVSELEIAVASAEARELKKAQS